MKITDVTEQKRNKNRVNVFIDEEYAFSLDAVDALRMGVKPGTVITEEKVQQCRMECDFSKAKEKAFDILSRKPVSVHDLKEKLFEKGFDALVADAVVAELEDLGYIDDTEYAKLFLEYAKEKLWGRRKIQYEMSQKGIPAEIVQEVLAEFSEDAMTDEMVSLIQTKYVGGDLKDPKVRARISRYFASRGYGFSQIDTAYRLALEESNNE